MVDSFVSVRIEHDGLRNNKLFNYMLITSNRRISRKLTHFIFLDCNSQFLGIVAYQLNTFVDSAS